MPGRSYCIRVFHFITSLPVHSTFLKITLPSYCTGISFHPGSLLDAPRRRRVCRVVTATHRHTGATRRKMNNAAGTGPIEQRRRSTRRLSSRRWPFPLLPARPHDTTAEGACPPPPPRGRAGPSRHARTHVGPRLVCVASTGSAKKNFTYMKY